VAEKSRQSTKSFVALLLTLTAGYVDIVGFLRIFGTFTAHMTGTTVHLGNALFKRSWNDVFFSFVVLAAFVIGSLIGRILIEIGARRKLRSIASWTLGLEAALLAMVATPVLRAGGSGALNPKLSLAMLAGAMGLQTATITRVGGLTIHTTFVTGMINKFSQLVSHALFETYDSVAGPLPAKREHLRHRAKTLREGTFIFSIWSMYLAGAVAGTWAQAKWQLSSLYAPVAIVCFAIIADQIRPLAVEEEKDQWER
jgi:uncharacterized membrane protein YoaK (UPF0700 family)